MEIEEKEAVTSAGVVVNVAKFELTGILVCLGCSLPGAVCFQVSTGVRKIVIAPIRKDKMLKVYDAVSGSVVRTIDLTRITDVEMQVASQGGSAFLQDGAVLLRFAKLYDMVMRFQGSAEPFCNAMADFLESIDITHSRIMRPESEILANSFTKDDRQALVEEFFRLLFRESLAESGPQKPRRAFNILRRGRSTKRKRQVGSSCCH